MFREAEGVGGWAVQERLHGVGAEPGSDGLDVDGRELGEALERCRVRDVLGWCRKKLGPSVQSQRRQAYGALQGATNPG